MSLDAHLARSLPIWARNRARVRLRPAKGWSNSSCFSPSSGGADWDSVAMHRASQRCVKPAWQCRRPGGAARQSRGTGLREVPGGSQGA